MRGRFLHRQPPPGSRVNTQHPLGHGCVGWWEMNVGSGLVVPDISGQDNHGTMTNMDASTDWVQGRHGGEGALEFHTQYVNCGQFPAGTFTDSALPLKSCFCGAFIVSWNSSMLFSFLLNSILWSGL